MVTRLGRWDRGYRPLAICGVVSCSTESFSSRVYTYELRRITTNSSHLMTRFKCSSEQTYFNVFVRDQRTPPRIQEQFTN
jgi:hypothetical protein